LKQDPEDPKAFLGKTEKGHGSEHEGFDQSNSLAMAGTAID